MQTTEIETRRGTRRVRCVSVWQPWATLMACGAKTVETRQWNTSIRGTVFIHAASTRMGLVEAMLLPTAVVESMEEALGLERWEWSSRLPFGALVARGCLSETLPAPSALDAYPRQESFGYFGEGRFAHIYESVEPIAPVPLRGGKGIFYREIGVSIQQDWSKTLGR